eukprot:TRINITY_DN14919_c0_g1_i2.p2 TRINITY_DN14919_c0_g1~~TRINITY_DN14919_c0_g1_i2.p2  ORF type:complete len:454 (+),score=160.61 TRINITY_DN14919_c0_g1_i2:1547-2908(+)
MERQMLAEQVRQTEQGVIQMIQARMVRMFEVRKEEHASLRFSEIEQLMRVSFDFIIRLERILAESEAAGSVPAEAARAAAQQRTAAFRATLTSQAREFFKHQHEKQQQKLLQILLHEQWQANDEIDASFQEFCDQLVDASDSSVARAKAMAVDRSDGSERPASPPQTEQAFRPRLMIPPREYSVAQSVLMLVQILAEYERYVCTLPFLAHDIIQRVHELLKCYDGQTAMLILGAQARETAGLETITATHLGVASQCLSFLADFAPRLKARLALILPAKGQTFLKNLDRFTKDVTDHRNEFYVKIITMVKERLEMDVSWRPEHWDQHGASWVLALLKELGRLLRRGGLERLIERQQLRQVVYPILYYYHSRMQACIQKIPGLQGNEALRGKVRDDILTYKVNVEKFGYSLTVGSRARDLSSAASWLPQGDEELPEDDDACVALFFSPRVATPPP